MVVVCRLNVSVSTAHVGTGALHVGAHAGFLALTQCVEQFVKSGERLWGASVGFRRRVVPTLQNGLPRAMWTQALCTIDREMRRELRRRSRVAGSAGMVLDQTASVPLGRIRTGPDRFGQAAAIEYSRRTPPSRSTRWICR
jgi:hypothetical protein